MKPCDVGWLKRSVSVRAVLVTWHTDERPLRSKASFRYGSRAELKSGDGYRPEAVTQLEVLLITRQIAVHRKNATLSDCLVPAAQAS